MTNQNSKGGPASDDPPCTIPPSMQAAVLALNNTHATELSWLDAECLSLLLDRTFYARRIGDVAAFLLAFDESADYDSPNFLWFCRHYRRFVYIDRVAVSEFARGRGYALRLYADLMAHAAAVGHDLIVCEVNFDPPNPASDAFHARLGFTEVGDASIHNGGKTVRYLVLPITAKGAEV